MNPHENERYLDIIMTRYADLRDPHAEERFFSNETFRNEIKFEPGEKILYLNYQNLKYALIKAALPILLVATVSYFVFSGMIQAVELAANSFAVFFWSLLIVLSVMVGYTLVKQFLQSKSYRYIITDRRIIVGYTFLQRWSRAVEYANIIDIVVHQSFFARWFAAGNVLLVTGGMEGAYVGGGQGAKATTFTRGFMNIKHPFQVKNLIKDLMVMYTEKHIDPPPLLSAPLQDYALKHGSDIGIQPDETVFKVYEKKQSSSLIKGLFTWLVIPFTIIFSLGDFSIIFALGTNFARFVGVVLLAGIIFIIVFSRSHARGFEYVITDKRIVMFKKFVGITVRDVIMGKITDISIFQMAAGRVANFGVIQIGTKGFERLLKFRDLYHIQGVADVPSEKDDIRNLVLYFQRGVFYSPLIEMYDPEFLNI